MDKASYKELYEFNKHHSIRRMHHSLVLVFIDFIMAQKEGEPLNMFVILNDIEALFELLVILEREK